MGKMPFSVVPGLVMTGLGLLCLVSIGCGSTGPKPLVKPNGRLTDASSGKNAWQQPPANVNNGGGLPPAIGSGPGTSIIDSVKTPPAPAIPSAITNMPNRPTIQPAGTTSGFDHGTKVGPGNLPGNTGGIGTSTSPSYLNTPGQVFPPPASDTIGAGAGLQPQMIPLPPASGLGRDPITNRASDPIAVPGATTGNPVIPPLPAINTTNYTPNTIKTTPTPTIPDAAPYLAPGSSNLPSVPQGDPLPPIGGFR